MKYRLFFLIVMLLPFMLLSGCQRKDEVVQDSDSIIADELEYPASEVDKVVHLETGLSYIDKVLGDGEEVAFGDIVAVHYVGKLSDGTQFDSSFDRGEPLVFQIGLGNVIPGWEQGLMKMRVGGKRRLVIPPNLGYGPEGVPGRIPPDSTLFFEINVVGVQ